MRLIGTALVLAVAAGLLVVGAAQWTLKPPDVAGFSLGQVYVAVACLLAIGALLTYRASYKRS